MSEWVMLKKSQDRSYGDFVDKLKLSLSAKLNRPFFSVLHVSVVVFHEKIWYIFSEMECSIIIVS